MIERVHFPYIVLFLVAVLSGCPKEIANQIQKPIALLDQTSITALPGSVNSITLRLEGLDPRDQVTYDWEYLPAGVTVNQLNGISSENKFQLTTTLNAAKVQGLNVTLKLRGYGWSQELTLKLIVVGPPTFLVNSTPLVLTMGANATATLPIKIERVSGYAEPVTVAVSNLPSGVTTDPLTIEPLKSEGVLTLHTTPRLNSFTNSSVSLVFTTADKRLEQPLVISVKGDPFFRISVNSLDPQFTQGETKKFTFLIQRFNGFDAPVTLVFDSLPLGFRSVPVTVAPNASSAEVVVQTSQAVPGYTMVPVKLRGNGGGVQDAYDVSLTVLNAYTEIRYGIESISPSNPAPGERVKATVSVVNDVSQRSVGYALLDSSTNTRVVLGNATSSIRDFDWNAGSYKVDIAFDAPLLSEFKFKSFYFSVGMSGSTKPEPIVEVVVQSKVASLPIWFGRNINVFPGCLIATFGSTQCGTTANLFPSGAYAALGLIPYIDDTKIALPTAAIARRGYENGFDASVKLRILPDSSGQIYGSVSKLNKIWYYTAQYNLADALLQTYREVQISIESSADPVAKEIATLYLQPFWVLGSPSQGWSPVPIPDNVTLELRVRPMNGRYPNPYHLKWTVVNPSSLVSSVGANGSISQDGCLTPPRLATATSRDITVVASVVEIPGIEVRETIRVTQGVAATYLACGSWTGNNGWTQ